MTFTQMHTHRNGEALTLRVAVLYDEFDSGCKAKAFLDQMTAPFEVEMPLRVVLWRMDVLQIPGVPEMALHDFGCADMLVLALQPGSALPPKVLNWVESWATVRAEQDSALVVLWSPPENGRVSETSLRQLQRVSERHGLSPFLPNGSPSETGLPDIDPRPAVLSEASTHEVDESGRLGFSRSRHAVRWGLNE